MVRMSEIWAEPANPGRSLQCGTDAGGVGKHRLGGPALCTWQFPAPPASRLSARGRLRPGYPLGGPLRRQLYPKAQRAPPHRPAREGQPGDLARQGRDSPRRSSTAHTSARRPPRADAARSGAFQARPARSSRACTNSRPSALAWATSSFSVGERSKASMISAAKTEERRSTSMAGTRARGAAPAGRQRSVSLAGQGGSGSREEGGQRGAGRGAVCAQIAPAPRAGAHGEAGPGAAPGKGRGQLRVTVRFCATSL